MMDSQLGELVIPVFVYMEELEGQESLLQYIFKLIIPILK